MAARNVARVRVEAFGSPTRREEKIGLAMSADEARALDHWRLHQSPILSRSEAIRQLIVRGMATHQDLTTPLADREAQVAKSLVAPGRSF
jgi:hypothetical protein